MKLILSGGGKGKTTKKLDELFKKLVLNGKVLYLPQARKEKEYSKCLEWVKKNIHENAEINLTVKNLKKYKGIFIGGGNTFKLLHELKELFEKLRKFDGIIYGGSAGAAIFGKSIITCSDSDENKVKLKNLNGLNLVNGYSIYCHYTNQDEFIKKLNMKVIALPESSGLFIDDKIKVIGKAFVFDKEKKKLMI